MKKIREDFENYQAVQKMMNLHDEVYVYRYTLEYGDSTEVRKSLIRRLWELYDQLPTSDRYYELRKRTLHLLKLLRETRYTEIGEAYLDSVYGKNYIG